LFILPLIIFWFYVEYGLQFIPTSYGKLKSNFYKCSNNIEVLVIGNSESQLGVAPKYFKKYRGFNLSNVSQPLYVSSELVLKNLDKMKSLKMVILSVGPMYFFENTKDSREKWREKFYYYFWGIHPEYGKPNYTWNFRTSLYNTKTLLNYAIHGFYNIPTPFVDAIDSTGWERGYFKNSSELLNDDMGAMSIKLHLENMRLKYYYKNVDYIKTLKYELKKKGIKLIVIQLPKSKYYRKYIPKKFLVKNIQKVYCSCKEVKCKAHSKAHSHFKCG